ncbi:MerR family transcriptional regulator [Paenibacillus glycinis]|uniref:MerR family transcriptional regulator n=1 Tax=Paenibacillus glycinis TaxID=2697035 RepID=A0ABW9XXN1_9BACL|nr:MerR family transcriptional regulator [Paenibacillus glycinis]NBD27482.1 MerR family transcriptional regulator [Paenibacillus glycinis]
MPFSIKEASQRLGCPAHTIRYYEKEGLLPFIERDEQGNRVFEERDLDWMRLMTCFRATGMKVADLKQIVDLALLGESTIPQRQAILEAHKEELRRRQADLDVAFEAVNRKLTVYDEIARGKVKPGREMRMDGEEG